MRIKCLLVALLLCCSLPGVGSAQEEIVPFLGAGTADDPYRVSNAEQLNAVRNYLGAHFRQTANINLEGIAWQPIGSWNEDNDENIGIFSGVYDGNGYVIRNMNINVTDNRAAVGLFGVVSGEIRNVNLVNCHVEVDKSSMDYMDLNKFQIDEVIASWVSSVPPFSSRRVCTVGTILGTTYGEEAKISDCTAEGDIKADNLHDAIIGGVAGFCNGGDRLVSSVEIYAVLNKSARFTDKQTVWPADGTIGGVIGCPRKVSALISNCANHGTIQVDLFGGGAEVGGISGRYGTVQSCVNHGELKVNIEENRRGNTSVGGISGSCGYISKCVNYGSIDIHAKYNSGLTYAQAGGISGTSNYSNTINDSINMAEKLIADGPWASIPVQYGTCFRISDGAVMTENYSIASTRVNQELATEYIGTDQKNGASLSQEEALAFIESLNLNVPNPYLMDTDGDGFYDIWEKNGCDFDFDGVVDIPIHLMGADPLMPDVFIEIDWMVKDATMFSKGKSFAPNATALKMLWEVFNAHGINLHIDAGPDSKDYVTGEKWGNLSEGGEHIQYKEKHIWDETSPTYGDLESLLNKHFRKARSRVFKYGIYCDILKYKDDTDLGLALRYYGILAVSKSKVSDAPMDEATVFMHELGHLLGLPDDEPLYKPNNLSVMNYITAHFDGLLRSNGSRVLNYSEYTLPALDENHLNEYNGLDPYGETLEDDLSAKFMTTGLFGMKCIDLEDNSPIAYMGIDFNRNNKKESDIKCDINGDGKYTYIAPSYNEWEALDYKAAGGISQMGDWTLEDARIFSGPSQEELYQMGLCGAPGDAEVSGIMPSLLYASSKGQSLIVTLKNLNPAAAQVTLTAKGNIIAGGEQQAEASIAASDTDFTYARVEIPVADDLVPGNFTFTLSLDCNNGTTAETTHTIAVEGMPAITLENGGTHQIDDLNDPDALVWGISDEGIASVKEGLITAKAPGRVVATVTNSQGDMRSWQLTVKAAPIVILQQPQDQTVEARQQAAFAVEASGGSLSYQWQVNRNDGRGWQAIENAFAPLYTTGTTKEAHDGYLYRCALRSDSGEERMTDAAVLHVIPEILLPETGDSSRPGSWIALALGSAVVLFAILRKRQCLQMRG